VDEDRQEFGPTGMPGGAVEETIDAYDAGAEDYGNRLANVDFDAYLSRFTEGLPGGPVLDAGCGPGRDLARFVMRGISAVGLDRSEGMLSVARRVAPQAHLVLGDLRRLPFTGSTFGGVWHCASLLHLSPQQAATAMAEVRRVLVLHGIVFLSVAKGDGAVWRETPTGRRWFYYYSQSEIESLVRVSGMELGWSAVEPGVVRGTWINTIARKVA
jgi:ubiquinone/menaquinone biosynthesis C-methylase UbiE